MRRRYLWLLAVFVPTVLGLAALTYLIFAPESQSEASPTTPIVRHAPRVEDTISDESVAAPADNDALAPSEPVEDEAIELPETKPESRERPAQLESSDIIGPPMLASSSDIKSSSDAPAPAWSRRSLRLASLSARGGGGAPSTNGSAKTSGDSAANPADVSNTDNNDSSTPGGSSGTNGSGGTDGDTDPSGDKGEGTNGDGGAAPNIPNPDHEDEDQRTLGPGPEDPDHEQDPPTWDNDPYPTDPLPHDDDQQPVQVPEPASFGLLLLGLAGCAAGRRRKK